MEYYHLVTRIPMCKGQIIDFSNGEHNRLYEFWMKREDKTEDGRDIFSILNDKQFFDDEEQKVLLNYVFCQSRAGEALLVGGSIRCVRRNIIKW